MERENPLFTGKDVFPSPHPTLSAKSGVFFAPDLSRHRLREYKFEKVIKKIGIVFIGNDKSNSVESF